MITVTTSISHDRELFNLAKIFPNNTKYNSCNKTIFHNICSKADILSKAKMKAYSTMLKGLTLDNYYSNINISIIIINFN